MDKALRRLRKVAFVQVQDTKASPRQLSNATCSSHFDGITQAAPNAIFHTKARYKADPDPRKMNLGMGAYRTNDGLPYVLKAVRQAEALLLADHTLNKEYLPITGHAGFAKCAQKLIFGKSSTSISSVQCISGTGSLAIGARFIAKFFPQSTVYFSAPTWGNHGKIFLHAGVPTKTYPYWDGTKRELAYDSLMQTLKTAPSGSVVLLHATAHNPTGVDPTRDQWKAIAALCKEKNFFPFFDSAYQGFASGDLDRDAWAIRYFVSQGFELLVCQSFAKNLGLYNERIGCLHVLTRSEKRAKAVSSQIALFIRPMYSNPPVHGARIVEKILSTPHLYEGWKVELKAMSERISDMRPLLRGELEKLGTPGDWSNITSQIGMFSFTGLTKPQAEALCDNHHIYLLSNGRISMSGVTTSNVAYLAKSIDYVVRNH